jgi:hypothetical protein
MKTKDKPKKPFDHTKAYPAIPNSTIINLMGEKRWNRMLQEVKRKHRTRKVILSHTNEGPKLHLRNALGKCIGTVAHVERWADKQRKLRRS